MSREGTAAFAIAYVHYVTDEKVTLTVEQIRTWARRGYITRVGKDPDGFTLYNIDKIIERIRLTNPDALRHADRGSLCPEAVGDA